MSFFRFRKSGEAGPLPAVPEDLPPSETNDKGETQATNGLDTDKTAILDEIAAWVAQRRLGPAAILALESVRPLHRLGSHGAVFFEPFLTMIFSHDKYRLFREALEEERYLDYLVTRIEALEP